MELTFKVDQVEILIGYTKELLFEGADHRRGFDEPGLILASQFGAGVYLMSSLVDGEDDWTGRLVFAELCNPSEADYVEGVAGGAYGDEEAAELIPLVTPDRLVAWAKNAGRDVLAVVRNSDMEDTLS
jgi:hypothetical protein